MRTTRLTVLTILIALPMALPAIAQECRETPRLESNKYYEVVSLNEIRINPGVYFEAGSASDKSSFFRFADIVDDMTLSFNTKLECGCSSGCSGICIASTTGGSATCSGGCYESNGTACTSCIFRRVEATSFTERRTAIRPFDIE